MAEPSFVKMCVCVCVCVCTHCEKERESLRVFTRGQIEEVKTQTNGCFL